MKMLPIHPQPLENELLSSWITRLAIANGLYSHSFFNSLLEFKGVISSRDIDRLDSPELLKVLARVSGKSHDEIAALKLSSLQGQVFENQNLSGRTRWVLPLGIYHRTKQKNGLVYCPLCLQQDKIRYFRKSWRLAFITLCHTHQCILWDHCPYCKATVDYQRLGIGRRQYELPLEDLGLCHHCYKPLWKAPIQYLTLKMDILSTPYRHFITSFNTNKPVLPSLNQPLNLQVFGGLWILTGRMMSRRAATVRARIFKETSIVIPSEEHHESFEYLTLKQRLSTLIAIFYYLQDWPDKFINLVKGTTFTLSAFSDDIEKSPFWLSSVVTQNLSLRQYSLTDEEIVSATNYLKSHQVSFTKSQLANLLGIDISSLAKRLKSLYPP